MTFLKSSTSSPVIGNLYDTHSDSSIYSRTELLNEHIHSVCQCYPTLAAGATITAGAGAWTLSAAYAVVIPTNTIPYDFDIHFINVETLSANASYELVLYGGADGSEIEIGRVRFTRTAVNEAANNVVINTPVQAAGTQIKAKLASSNAAGPNVTVSLFYHRY